MSLKCDICFHHCELDEGRTGLCRARANRGGQIVPLNYGRLTSLALDPIEKKPLRRFLTDRRVDPPLRPYLAVLAVENEVLWIPRLCASERLRLNAVPAGSVRLQVLSGDPYR